MSSEATRPTVSVLMITRNAERLLREALESVRWADQVVVVDSGSTDRTEAIAREFTSDFHYQEYSGHGRQRQRTLELATSDWIFYLDADEVVTPGLRESIRRIVGDPQAAHGYEVQLQTWFMGRWFGTRGWRREWKLRLFRRDRGSFNAHSIHEGAEVEPPIGRLPGALLHYPYRDLEHFAGKMNEYSTAIARDRYDRGDDPSIPYAVARATAIFLRDYFLWGNFLYGGAGLAKSVMFGYYTFLKYAKVRDARVAAERPREYPARPLTRTG